MQTLDDPPHFKIWPYLISFSFLFLKIFPRCYIPIFDGLVQVDVGASSEGGEVWGGSAQLLGLRPSTQYEVIFLVLLDVGTVD